jgi:hypothetical protein
VEKNKFYKKGKHALTRSEI